MDSRNASNEAPAAPTRRPIWAQLPSTRSNSRWPSASLRRACICWRGLGEDDGRSGRERAGDDCDRGRGGMTAKIIPFVPRNSTDRRPMLEQIAVEAVESISVPEADWLASMHGYAAPKCHDDLRGGSVLPTLYENSLGYVEGKEPA